MSSSDQFATDAAALHAVLERLDTLEDRVDDLEAENQQLREANAELEDTTEWLIDYTSRLEDAVFGEWTADVALDDLESESLVDATLELSEDVAAAEDAVTKDDLDLKVGLLRSEHGAQIRHVAEESGVDLGEHKGDIVTQIRERGIDAVGIGRRVYRRHRRAEILLKNIEDWGEQVTIKPGMAYRLERPSVRRLLNAHPEITVDLQSKNTGEVFDAIIDITDGSPRFTRRREEDSTDVLYVGWPNTGVSE